MSRRSVISYGALHRYIGTNVISIPENAKRQSFATTEEPLFCKSSMADKEVPLMSTQRTGYELGSAVGRLICVAFLNSFFFYDYRNYGAYTSSSNVHGHNDAT